MKKYSVDTEGFRTPRWLGYVYIMLFVTQIILNQLIGKLFYVRMPSLSSSELLFIRSASSVMVFALFMNRKIPLYMYRSIEKRHYKDLAVRVIVGALLL